MASSSTDRDSCSLPIGIDFGTTTCCVAVHRHLRPGTDPEVLDSDYGTNTTPSYVAYALEEEDAEDRDKCAGADGEVDVYAGQTAKDLAYENPGNTIFDVKRLIGRSFHDLSVQRYKKLWPFELVNMHGFVGVNVHGETLLPQIIATKLMSHLKKTAEEKLGLPVDSAVVTVPVYFTSLQIGLTQEACIEAGFKNIQFIAEPVAAAIAYRHQMLASIHENDSQTCLIFDIGGGTFDVMIFQLDAQKEVKIKATGGDDRLGGEDFNDLLTEYCISEFQKRHGVNLAEGKASDDADIRKKTARRLRRIRSECERQKCFLAAATTVIISLDSVHGDLPLVVPVTREIFEKLIDPLLTKCIVILDETLDKSGSKKSEIHDVILIGGSSRIPKVQKMVAEYFGDKVIRRSIDADEAVACGAAIQARNVFMQGDASFSAIPLLELKQFEPQSLKIADDIQVSTATTTPLPKKIRWGTEMSGFPPRSRHAAVAVGDNIYSFGGYNEENDSTYARGGPMDVHVLNVKDTAMKWTPLVITNSKSSPSQRYDHSAVLYKEFVIIFGGFDTKERRHSSSVYIFNTRTLTWDKPEEKGAVPWACSGHSAVLIKNQMVVFGGWANHIINDLYSLNLENFIWSKIEKGIPPTIRYSHSAVVFKDRFMLIFGGWEYMENAIVNTVMSYDAHTMSWSVPETSGNLPKSRKHSSAFMHDGLMYIFGGCSADDTYFNDLFSYNPETLEWKEVVPIGRRSGAGCVVTLKDQVYMFGGCTDSTQFLDDTCLLELA